MDGFRLHKGNGEVWQFREFASGLYYFDLNNSNKRTLTEYSLFNTVSDLENQYSKKQVIKARLARNIQIRIGRPSERRFLKILENNELRNCPVTVEDGRRAMKVYGPDVASKKGVTVKGKGQVKSVFIPSTYQNRCTRNIRTLPFVLISFL